MQFIDLVEIHCTVHVTYYCLSIHENNGPGSNPTCFVKLQFKTINLIIL